MLTIVASPSQIGEVLATGAFSLRPPRSVQVLLSGRVRPFVCVRDAALELLRRGLGEVIEQWVEGARMTYLILRHGSGSNCSLQCRRAVAPVGITPPDSLFIIGQ